MPIEVFARGEDIVGEGPLWSAADNGLYWLDIGRSRLYRQTLGGQRAQWGLPNRAGCVERLRDGTLILAFGEGLHRLDPVTGCTQLIARAPLPPGARFNEGKCDPRGRLWFGSMQDNFGPGGEAIPLTRSDGSLFRFGVDGSMTMIEDGIGISNTLAWSPDERLLYFSDSSLNQIFVFDFDAASGELANKRVFFDLPELGLPDGSAMDVDGCLWNARWGAGVVVRLTPNGRIDRTIEIPAPQPSSCIFGGPGLDTLFITSARNGLSAPRLEQHPLSGSVFALTGAANGVPIPAVAWEAGE